VEGDRRVLSRSGGFSSSASSRNSSEGGEGRSGRTSERGLSRRSRVREGEAGR